MAGRKRREPDLLAYTDFRKYLRDYYAFRKSQDRRYSYGVFAKRAAIPLRWHLKAVLDYGRNLSQETLAKYKKALGLTGLKGEYFSLLVAFGQAANEEKREAAGAALRLWRVDHTWKKVPAKDSTRDPWARSLVKALSRAPGFRADPRWIHPRLRGSVTPKAVGDAMALLRKEGCPGEEVLYEGKTSESSAPMTRFRSRLYREATLKRNRALGFGGNWHFILAMTREEARELDRKLFECLKANLPSGRAWRPGSAVCVVLGNVFAVSEPI